MESVVNSGIVIYFIICTLLFQCLLFFSDLANTVLNYLDYIAYAWPSICVSIYLIFFSDLNFAAPEHAPFAYLFYLGACISWAAMCGLFLLNSMIHEKTKG